MFKFINNSDNGISFASVYAIEFDLAILKWEETQWIFN